MKAVVGLSANNQVAAIDQLRDLLAEAEAAQSDSVSRWHVQQSVGLLAQLERERGASSRAAELYEQAAREAFADYRGAKVAAAWRFAEAALLRFEAGDRAEGLELAAEAFSLAEPELDPSVTYERLVAQVRLAREAEAGGA